VTATVICQRCGTENPGGFKFCGACAAPLSEAEAPRQTRKVVTALFCDVVGSTSLGEELDPEVLRGVMNRYFAEMRLTIERHGGTVEKFIGDAVMAVFGVPKVHEDDALRAVRAAGEIRDRLPTLAGEAGVTLQFRTGVNTGPVLTGEGENLAIGDAVNVAARLEQAARPGEIVIGGDTLQLVRDAVEVEPLEPLTLKGKAEPLAAYRLLRVDPAAPGHARHFDVPLVGRERELQLLRQAWDRAVQESGCHLFTLLGPAGVGKSRLVGELLAGLGDAATVLRGRCLHYGDGITFWPLVEALLAVGDPAVAVLERLDAGGAATPEELFWEVRRLLESLARQRPLVLHVDDLQWAEPMLLDLLDHVVDLSRGAPILLLCTARPELLDDRPGWGGGKLNATTVLLEPLGATDSEALLDQLGDGLDPKARARVIAASEGNPLFLEEMVALARERGTVAVPPTIQALLAARLERLAAEERELLERGAVEGEVFHRLAVQALAGERLATEVELRLAGLVRKELIRPHPATIAGDDAFRFRHLLIRDAAYDGLPKVTRAELHERFARWLEDAAAGMPELDEIAGWHMEQSVRYRRELGQESDPQVARRAAEHLHTASGRARERGDSSAARSLLDRALTLVPEEDALYARLAVDLAEQLIEVGDLGRADELLTFCEHRPEVATFAALNRLEWINRTRPVESTAAIERQLPELLEQLAADGDERGLAKAHMVGFFSHWLESQAQEAEKEVRLAAEHARRAGDMGLRSRALSWYMASLFYGPRDSHTVAAELDALEREEKGPYLAAFLKTARAELLTFEGSFEQARRQAQQSIEDFAALGGAMEFSGWQALADAERAAGDLDAALVALLRSDEIMVTAGDHAFRSTNQADIADVQELRGNRAAAQAAIELSEGLSASVDLVNFATTHRVRARMALADGEPEEAERWARSAVEFAFRTDFPKHQAETKLGLAHVLRARARLDEAREEAQAALELYEAKGDRISAARVGALIDEIGTG